MSPSRVDDVTDIDAEIVSWFATPIVSASIPGGEQLNRELVPLFLEREQAGDAFRHEMHIPTQVGPVFESRFDLFEWPDAPVQRLAGEVHSVLFHVVGRMNGYSAEEMADLTFYYDSWFHVTRSGGYQSIHYHPRASWSGIYAVQVGDGVEERPESGQVKFYDPRGPVFMHVDPGNERLEPRYTANPVYLGHQPGQLVIFPSWLMHEVLPYVGRRERIVVAFNAWISRGG
jgi:uncharacterized protein (TIGR02466 family)